MQRVCWIMLGVIYCATALTTVVRADIALVSLSGNVPLKFNYPGNNLTSNTSARAVFLLPGVGGDLSAHVSVLNTGLYLGGSLLRLVDFDQGYLGHRAKMNWSMASWSVRWYAGNLLLKKSAIGPWIGVLYGHGAVDVDYDDVAVTDLHYAGRHRGLLIGADLPLLSLVRVGVYYGYHDIKTSNGPFIAQTLGLSMGLSI